MKEILVETNCLSEGEIKRYIAEESSQKELRRVENHLLDCPFCSDAVEGFEGYYGFETDKNLEALKSAIGNGTLESEEVKVVPMQRKTNFMTFNRVAAAILLLVLPTATWFYMSNNNLSNTNGFVENEVLRSSENMEVVEKELSKVISLYEAKQYEAALAASQTLLVDDNENVKTTYYAALSAFKAEEFKLAAEYFMTVRMNSEFYYEEATWLEAQAYIGLDNIERAKKILDGIVEKGGAYKDEAIVLRKTLE